jgi:hypothetical protein
VIFFPSPLFGGNPAAGAAFSSATITVPSGKTASNLSNYPVYLRLSDMPANFWSAVSSDGGNIRIKQSGSVIPFDVVVIDKVAKTGTIFFKASTLASASSNIFTLDLTGGALLTSTDPNGRNAVWSAFDWVWMGDSVADVGTLSPALVDRTGGAAGSFTTGSMSSGASMGLNPEGCGIKTNGSGSRFLFTGRPSRTVLTIGGSARRDVSSITSNNFFIGYYTSTSVRMGTGIRDTTTDNWTMWDDVNSWLPSTGPALSSNNTVGLRIHAVYNGSTHRKYYFNGAINQTDAPITARPGTDNAYVVGDSKTSGGEAFSSGYLSYLYSFPGALSADYIAAEYSNLNAPASFYTIT